MTTPLLSQKMRKQKTGNEIYIHQDAEGSLKLVYCVEEYTFAHSLRNAARLMRNSARDLPADESFGLARSGYIYGAIVLSYSALEAALNEIIYLRALVDSSPLDEPTKDAVYEWTQRNHKDEQKHVLMKFNKLLGIIGKSPLPTRQRIYQHADLVRVLRNLIVHPIPGRVVTYVDSEDYDYTLQQKIVRRLRSVLKLEKTATFPKDVVTCRCAEWAVQSCENFLSAFLDESGIDIGFTTGRRS